MYFSYQTLVLAALAFGTVLAQPAHRQMHQHHPRALSDVLGKRDPVNWDSLSTYKNPKTGQPYTPAEWTCFVEKHGDASCDDDGSSSPAPSAPAAPAPEEKLAVEPSHSPSAPAPSQPVSSGHDSDSGPGAHIFNKGSTTQKYVFYENNPFGQNTVPDKDKTITLAPGSDKFVPLPTSWKGHVQRGQSDPTKSSAATWAEIQVEAGDGMSWGDISLQKGCDGPALIISPTTGDSFGFTKDIISGAPDAAKVKTLDGQDALGYAQPGYMGDIKEPANEAAVAWENQQVGEKEAYIANTISGTNCVQSSSQVLHVEFY